MLCWNTFIRTPVPLRGHTRSNPLRWENNNVAASFLLTLGKCKDSHDRLEKTSARWTVNTAIVLRCLASSAHGSLNWGWWNMGGRGGVVVRTGGDEVGRVICCQLKRQQGSWTSFFLKKCFPPEGQDAVGPSLSCNGMALTNQPPSVFSSAAAWHVKQQLIESLVHFGFTSVAALWLCVLFVFLGFAQCFFWTHSKKPVTRIFHWLLLLNFTKQNLKGIIKRFISSFRELLQLQLFANRGW